MNDDLQQLLLNADATAPTPSIDVQNLPARIRRTARHQRRLAACGLAVPIALLCLMIPWLIRRTPSPKEASIPRVFPGDIALSRMDANMHARTAALLEASENHPKSSIDPTDTFLVNLATQRNQTALLLLHDADHLLSTDHRVAAVATLRKAIALFPGTPAATRANKQLEQLESRSQS